MDEGLRQFCVLSGKRREQLEQERRQAAELEFGNGHWSSEEKSRHPQILHNAHALPHLFAHWFGEYSRHRKTGREGEQSFKFDQYHNSYKSAYTCHKMSQSKSI
ncbi:hypothetical protein GW17_00052344 [Ensete ventricosum]|nr:hypothetical protein GW17_00052344 [Ensete ventricosum]